MSLRLLCVVGVCEYDDDGDYTEELHYHGVVIDERSVFRCKVSFLVPFDLKRKKIGKILCELLEFIAISSQYQKFMAMTSKYQMIR